jgi:uncharacterized small protein (DUF1192 family)
MADTKFSSDHQPETTTKTRPSIKQEIAALEAKIARKREAVRKLSDGQKIIIGGMMLALADKDPAAKKRLVELIEQNVKREADVKRIAPLVEELKRVQAQTANAPGAGK